MLSPATNPSISSAVWFRRISRISWATLDWSESCPSAHARCAQAAAVTMLVASSPSSRHASTEIGTQKDPQGLLHSVGLAEALGHSSENGLHRRHAWRRTCHTLERKPDRMASSRLLHERALHRPIYRGNVDALEGPRGTAPGYSDQRRAARALCSRIATASPDRLSPGSLRGQAAAPHLSSNRLSSPHITPVLAWTADI